MIILCDVQISCNHGFIVRSGNKFLTIAGTAVLATVGGSVALAKTSDGFRKFSEKNIPGSSFLYNLLLGPPVSHIPVFTPPVRYVFFPLYYLYVSLNIFISYPYFSVQIFGRRTSKEKVRTRSIKEDRWYLELSRCLFYPNKLVQILLQMQQLLPLLMILLSHLNPLQIQHHQMLQKNQLMMRKMKIQSKRILQAWIMKQLILNLLIKC